MLNSFISFCSIVTNDAIYLNFMFDAEDNYRPYEFRISEKDSELQELQEFIEKNIHASFVTYTERDKDMLILVTMNPSMANLSQFDVLQNSYMGLKSTTDSFTSCDKFHIILQLSVQALEHLPKYKNKTLFDVALETGYLNKTDIEKDVYLDNKMCQIINYKYLEHIEEINACISVYTKKTVKAVWEYEDSLISEFLQDTLKNNEANKEQLLKITNPTDYNNFKKTLQLFGINKQQGKRNNQTTFEDLNMLITELDLNSDIKSKMKNDYSAKAKYIEYTKHVYESMIEDKQIYACYITPSQCGIRILYKTISNIQDEAEYTITNKHYTANFKNIHDLANYFEIDTSKMSSQTGWFVPIINLHINKECKAVRNIEPPELPHPAPASQQTNYTPASQQTKAISFQIAEKSDYFEWKGDYLRGVNGICVKFGHKDEAGHDGYIMPANKLDSIAYICGGTEHTLRELVKALDVDYEDYILKEEVKEVKINVDFLNDYIKEFVDIDEYSSIKEAYDSNDPSTILKAPTGSGKSYGLISYCLENLLNEKTFLIAVSNKKELQQYTDTFEKISNTTIKDLGIFALTSETRKNLPNKFTGIITIHEYVNRRGDSNKMYGATCKVLEKIDVIYIDEAESYLTSLTKHIKLGSRYKRQYSEDKCKTTYRKIEKCPLHTKTGNCTNCVEFDKFDYNNHNEHSIDRYILPKFIDGEKIDIYNNIEIDFETDNEIYIRDMNMIIKNIKNISPKNCILGTFEAFLLHLVNHSYNPTIIKHVLLKNNSIIEQNDVKKLYGNETQFRKLTKELKDLMKEVKAPSQHCEIRHLILKDKFPIQEICKGNKQITFISATYSKDNIRFIKEILPNFKFKEVKATHTRIDNLLIISLENKISISREELADLKMIGDVLIFSSTKKTSQITYEKLRRGKANYKVEQYVQGGTIKIHNHNNSETVVLITYTRSALSHGIDMPKSLTTIVTAENYKPAIAVDVSKYTQEEYIEAIQVDRFNTIIQDAGRILRNENKKYNRKVIILHSINKDDVETLVKIAGWQSLVTNKIKTLHYIYSSHYKNELKMSLL